MKYIFKMDNTKTTAFQSSSLSALLSCTNNNKNSKSNYIFTLLFFRRSSSFVHLRSFLLLIKWKETEAVFRWVPPPPPKKRTMLHEFASGFPYSLLETLSLM